MVGALETQHALSTQLIELTGETTADATTYGRAVHFGKGEDEGRSFTARGMYKDKLVKAVYDGREDWRITERRDAINKAGLEEEWPEPGVEPRYAEPRTREFEASVGTRILS
ncbi:hypothetical protein EDB81DRAFT_752349 [Dactylonectria macrodidyma]|uniref:SnoaL-like domain-containing protein n=1 Tax=Dactylonectria macrodidyma TaxID=307937 RepID=A0A9P9FVJ0_9HYPO|nr:hypothetical protein EDB81DRAFT_752349 [Dactylonectria macrodidyma]